MIGKRATKIWIGLVIGALCVGGVQAQTAGSNSEIHGRIYGGDGKTPLVGATVLAYHLSSEETFESEPTNAKGAYTLPALPYGYYDLAVRTPDGLYVADQVANVAPGEKSEVSFSIRAYGAAAVETAERRIFPAEEDEDPTGVAIVSQKMVGQSFWRSPKGIGIAAGGGALLLILIASGGDSSSGEPVASPSTP